MMAYVLVVVGRIRTGNSRFRYAIEDRGVKTEDVLPVLADCISQSMSGPTLTEERA